MFTGAVQLTITVHDKDMRDALWNYLEEVAENLSSPDSKLYVSREDMLMTLTAQEDFETSRKTSRFQTLM